LPTTWSKLTDDPLESGGDLRHDEPVERQREKWRLCHGTNSRSEIQQHVRGVTAPEDLHMLPQDLDFLPQEVNAASLTDWTTVPDPD